MYVVLAGGVGGARFLRGRLEVVPAEQVTVVVNTGDDYHLHGLHISPDIDVNIYTLAGAVHPQQGWGLAGDTFHCLEALSRYHDEVWFRLGDRDLATHLYRTQRLQEGWSLTRVTADLAARWGLTVRILPMSDDPVATRIMTPAGELHFQEYLVQRRAQDPLLGIRFAGVERARPAPGIREAIAGARALLIPPSNPFVSVGTILAVPGIREAIMARRAGSQGGTAARGGDQPHRGRTVKGPADSRLRARSLPVSPVGVAASYGDLLDGMVIDQEDAALSGELAAAGLRPVVTDTWMDTPAKAAALAQEVLKLAGAIAAGPTPAAGPGEQEAPFT